MVATGKTREEYWQEQYNAARAIFHVATPAMGNALQIKLSQRYADRKVQEIFGGSGCHACQRGLGS